MFFVPCNSRFTEYFLMMLVVRVTAMCVQHYSIHCGGLLHAERLSSYNKNASAQTSVSFTFCDCNLLWHITDWFMLVTVTASGHKKLFSFRLLIVVKKSGHAAGKLSPLLLSSYTS